MGFLRGGYLRHLGKPRGKHHGVLGITKYPLGLPSLKGSMGIRVARKNNNNTYLESYAHRKIHPTVIMSTIAHMSYSILDEPLVLMSGSSQGSYCCEDSESGFFSSDNQVRTV